MNLFRFKKPKPDAESKPVKKQNAEPPWAMLYADDDCFTRARKILHVAGVGDGIGLSGRMAETIELYRRLDREQAAWLAKNEPGPSTAENK